MRSLTTLGIAAMLTAGTLTGTMAQAQTSIYVYNFNDATASAAAGTQTAALFSVDKTAPGKTTGSTLSSNFANINITNFAGTAVHADGGDAAGQALALQGGTGAVAGGVGGNNGDYLQATADLTGFQNVGFSFANQATASGFQSDQFQYSLDGMNFINFAAPYTPSAAFATTPGNIETFDLSSIAALNNDPNAAFRIVFNGATSATGNNRLDNLVISGTTLGTPAVPEASTTVSFGLLLALGLGGLAVAKKRAARA
jgi:hypothetical protein